ncbi:hypothetical protein SAMN05444673_4088 [Bacillus sp. OV166]|uniref:hypothetical protein n=1 Tax=Bacillus sp. OV166 TaxID=1882763 RepID=UPI000A2AE92B|nr:hypothetical protein [Bacillus sp. OV166]SMQ81008.1 hypothetical protein SAMN05444673_4088 [Bacillus sp. OV166]
MEGKIKVEFEINAVGEETINGYDSSFKKYEIARTKNLSQTLTLGNLEEIINELFEEIQSSYENPEHLTAKIVIRAKKEKNKILYLG